MTLQADDGPLLDLGVQLALDTADALARVDVLGRALHEHGVPAERATQDVVARHTDLGSRDS